MRAFRFHGRITNAPHSHGRITNPPNSNLKKTRAGARVSRDVLLGKCSQTSQEPDDSFINLKDVYHCLLVRHTVGSQQTQGHISKRPKHSYQKQLFHRKESIASMAAVAGSRPGPHGSLKILPTGPAGGGAVHRKTSGQQAAPQSQVSPANLTPLPQPLTHNQRISKGSISSRVLAPTGCEPGYRLRALQDDPASE